MTGNNDNELGGQMAALSLGLMFCLAFIAVLLAGVSLFLSVCFLASLIRQEDLYAFDIDFTPRGAVYFFSISLAGMFLYPLLADGILHFWNMQLNWHWSGWPWFLVSGYVLGSATAIPIIAWMEARRPDLLATYPEIEEPSELPAPPPPAATSPHTFAQWSDEEAFK